MKQYPCVKTPTPKHHNITGAGSFGAPQIPQQGGVHIVPDTIASSGTLRLLCLLSAGPIAGLVAGAKSIFIDDVPLEDEQGERNFEGVTWSLANGHERRSPHRALGFNAVEQVESVGRTLVAQTPQELSRTKAHAARIALRFPHGLYERTRQVVAPTKVELTISTLHDTIWVVAHKITITEKRTNAFEKQILVYFPENQSTQKLRVERTSRVPETDNTLVSRVDLLAVTWLLWDKLSYADMGTLGLVIPSEATNGRLPRLSFDVKGREILVPSSYDPKTRAYQPLWDGRFVRAYCNNPAWVIFDLLHDAQFGLGIDKAHIALFDLLAIARHCDEMIDHPVKGKAPRHSFNAVISTRKPALRILQDICASIRVTFYWSGGKLHFTQDVERAPIRLLSNEGVEEGRFTYSGSGLRHSYSHVFVSFHDSAQDGRLGVETAFDEGAHRRHGYHPLEVFGFGITDRVEAMRHAKWLLHTAATARHSISYVASLDHYTDDPVRPGDVIAIDDKMSFYDKPALPTYQRRLLPDELAKNDKASPYLLTKIEYDGAYIVEDGVPEGLYRAFYQMAGQPIMEAILTTTVSQLGGRYKRVDLSRPTGNSDPNWRFPPIYTTVSIRPFEEAVTFPTYRIASVREISPHRVEITAIAYDKTRFGAIDAPVTLPDDVATDARLYAAPLTVVKSLAATQEDVWHNDILRHDVVVSWEDNRQKYAMRWQIEAKGPEVQNRRFEADEPHFILADLSQGRWDITVRLQRFDGFLGKAAHLMVEVLPEIAALPQPAKPVITPLREALSFHLSLPDITGRYAHFEIWLMADDGTAIERLAQSTATDITITNTVIAPASYSWRYVRPSGVISAFSPPITATPLPAAKDGEKGKDGKDGNDGADGQDGADGRDGADGLDGADGNDGADGRDGADGLDGADGKDGADGNDGADGLDGADGKDGADGRDGADGKDGADGADGRDGADGADGRDGADGKDGADGTDGKDGTIIVSHNITTAVWSAAQARLAIFEQAARLPQKGDIVTLINKAQSFAETRLYSGTVWQKNISLFSGAVLLDASVPSASLAGVRANQIAGGIFASTNYRAGQSGFAIDTSGNVEFNEAQLRGVLRSGRIEASHILSPTITFPTEAGGRFETSFISRPVIAKGYGYHNSKLTAGPMIIQEDGYSSFFADEGVSILTNSDRRGDNASRTQNNFYTRLRSSAPLVKATLAFRQSPNNWGKVISALGVEIIMRLGTSRVILTSQKFSVANNLLNRTYISFSANAQTAATGFKGVVEATYARVHVPRPGHSAASAGCTQSYAITLAFRPLIPTNHNLSNAPITFEFRISPTARNLSTNAIGAIMRQNMTLTMDSLA